MKKKKKMLLYSISTFLILCISYGVLFYFNFFQGFVTIKNGQVTSSALPKSDFESIYKPESSFIDMPVSEIKDVHINMLGNTIPSQSVLLKAQRYYIPLSTVCENLGYSIENNNSKLILKGESTITINDNTTCSINDKNYNFRGNILDYDSKKYIAISDIARTIFRL